MADPHVISALRAKRAEVAGVVEKLERRLEQHRADLVHLDSVLRLLQPDHDPSEIKPKRAYIRRTRYFAKSELPRLCLAALREAKGLLPTDQIAAVVIATKGFDVGDATLRTAIRDQVIATLRPMRKRGLVEQIGLGRGVRWKLASEA